MGKLFVIGDLHFSQTSNKPMDIFGRAWENHTERLCENWRAAVGEDDVVVVNGDISWGMKIGEAAADLILLDSLPGTKIIMKGNHELWWTSLAKINNLFRENGIKTIRPLYNNAYFWPEKRTMIFGTRGWSLPGDENYKATDANVVRRELMRLEASYSHGVNLAQKYFDYASGDSPERRFDVTEIIGKEVFDGSREYEALAFTHFPPFVFAKREPTDLTGFLEKNGIRRCCFGHIHGAYPDGGFRPVWVNNGVGYYLTAADHLKMKPEEIA